MLCFLGCCGIFTQFNLRSSPDMTGHDLRVRRDFHLPCRRIELMVHELVVVNQGWSRCILCVLNHATVATTWRVEEGPAKSLPCSTSFLLSSVL